MQQRVLVVDDSSAVREQIGDVLREGGYLVVEATDGRDGLEKVAQHPDLALVLCDVHMPLVDGIEMVRRVREDSSRATLPIVMLTAESDPTVIDRARRAGVKGWIVKPVKPVLLLATVRKLLGA